MGDFELIVGFLCFVWWDLAVGFEVVLFGLLTYLLCCILLVLISWFSVLFCC